MNYPHIESKTLEFKERIQDYRRVAESVVAFSNSQGGEIIIGIRDIDRQILGLSSEELAKYHEEIHPAIADLISPQVMVEVFEQNISDHVCMVIKVFPGPHKPYFLKKLGYPKGIFLRYGSHNRPADEYAINNLERKNRIIFENEICSKAVYEDLDIHAMERILNGHNKETLISCGYGEMDVDLELKAKNAGALLFSHKPSTWISEAYLTITQFASENTETIIKRQNFEGNIVNQFEAAFEYLKELFGSHFAITDKELRPQKSDYPLEAMREVLINAIVHRAYDYEAPVRISVFSNRFEVLNPGVFYAPINELTLRQGLSRYRNPLLSQAFRKLNYMEKQGVGINRIINSCSENGLPEPIFLELENFVKVTLFNRKYLQHSRTKENEEISDQEQIYLGYFKNKEKITSLEFAQLIGKSQATAKKVLKNLCEKQFISKKGVGRATYYTATSQ